MNTIFTTGYAGKKPEHLKTMVLSLDAALVDIRLVPRSRWAPHWNKGELAMLLGDNYYHVKELGNLNYKTKGEIQIADIDKGLKTVEVIATHGPVILMCGCADFQHCHRSVVAAELRRRGFSVEEIRDWRMLHNG